MIPTMTKRRHSTQPKRAIASADFLKAVPHKNRAMELTRGLDGSVLAEVPLNRPSWLVPPISWLMPYSSHRRVELDALGAAVLEMCDGRRRVEAIIETFADRNKLTFREAQLAVTQFLQQLTHRGLVAIVGPSKDARES